MYSVLSGQTTNSTQPRKPRELWFALDDLTEADAGLGRFLGQISPRGKDREQNESQASGS
jgi:hypothetical protein